MLTTEEVKNIAHLARIELSEAEITKYQKDLNDVLAYVDDLKQVDTEGLEIVAQVTGLENVMRKDVAEKHIHPEEFLEIAPEIKDGLYKVKSIL